MWSEQILPQLHYKVIRYSQRLNVKLMIYNVKIVKFGKDTFHLF